MTETSSSALPYKTGWVANGFSWSNRADKPFRFAVGSFIHEYKNTIDLVQKQENELVCRGTLSHCYPPTKIMFAPQKTSAAADIMISTADYLRVWSISDAPEGAGLREKDLSENKEKNENEVDESSEKEEPKVEEAAQKELMENKKQTINSSVALRKVFDFGKPNDFCSPVTSCDWNSDDPAIVGCCSIDTTVTIWNIEEEKHTVQLIAHDKDVYDIAFAKGTHTFASCGADGAVRVFDLREMEHCTIVWESPQLTPLLRVAWNKHEPTYLSTFGINDTQVVIIDIRYPSTPVGILQDGHKEPINSMNWAPHSAHHICTAGEDNIVNIWNNNELPRRQPSRFLTYDGPAPVNTISWSALQHEYIGITAGQQAQILRI
eukprot:GILI01014410.1.p1 GENE.GILI01014410.1~~GILI01014410.1.p1  ORF type:complete len:377 (+),score=43.11 GILI01014410.1:33-1163(+)